MVKNTEMDTEQITDKQSLADIGISSIIGTRKVQQDTVFGFSGKNGSIGIVCDGMGGLARGEIASRIAVQSLVDAWFECTDNADVPEFLKQAAIQADNKVFFQTDEYGRSIQTGTTVAAVIVKDKKLYWLSVGDSKIYIIRGTEIMLLNIEHNYRLELNLLLRQGKLTKEEYKAKEYQADALISYLGMGNVCLMDINQEAFFLEDGDIVLVSSDGLSRSMQERDILKIVRKNGKNMQNAANALTASLKNRKKQDNTSVVILRFDF